VEAGLFDIKYPAHVATRRTSEAKQRDSHTPLITGPSNYKLSAAPSTKCAHSVSSC